MKYSRHDNIVMTIWLIAVLVFLGVGIAALVCGNIGGLAMFLLIVIISAAAGNELDGQ